MAYLRDLYPLSTVEKVEHWNHFAKRRHDLFGWADILVTGVNSGFKAIQVTTRGQMSARRGKILGAMQASDKSEEYAEYRLKALGNWLTGGGKVEVHGWGQPGGKGTKWELTVWPVVLYEYIYRMAFDKVPRRQG